MTAGDGSPPAPLSVDVEVVAAHPEGKRFDPERIATLTRFVLSTEGAVGAWSVTVALVDDEALRQLHDRFMGIPMMTDVMTFPLQTDSVDQMSVGGDIVISLDRAFEQGPEHGFDGERETSFLVVHGLLHLLGWDDATTAMREQMWRRQETLLRAFDER